MIRSGLMIAVMLMAACGDEEPVEKCKTSWWVDSDLITSDQCIYPSQVEEVKNEVTWMASRYFEPLAVHGALTGLYTHFDDEPIEGPDGDVFGVFRAPNTVEVWLNTKCPAASSYAHELSHAILFEMNSDLTHDDPRFFVQRDENGEIVSEVQRGVSIEVKAALAACKSSCPKVKCTLKR